jgi:hypothetical protein
VGVKASAEIVSARESRAELRSRHGAKQLRAPMGGTSMKHSESSDGGR